MYKKAKHAGNNYLNNATFLLRNRHCCSVPKCNEASACWQICSVGFHSIL